MSPAVCPARVLPLATRLRQSGLALSAQLRTSRAIASNATSSRKQGGKKAIEEIYRKKTQREHILLRPDTYIGSTEMVTERRWLYDGNAKDGHMAYRECSYVPGLYKIFDEILVNASDNHQRDNKMDTLRVDIDRERGRISVKNNGSAVPVEMHGGENVYVPELIFGHLLTGSNFDDDELKVTGGRNGFGAKLTNIFSTDFTVDIQDVSRGLGYKQTFRHNMGTVGEAVIKQLGNNASGEWTKVTFKPDFQRFGMVPAATGRVNKQLEAETGLNDDIVALMSKRVWDIKGCNPQLKVWLNGERIGSGIRSFHDYVKMFVGAEEVRLTELRQGSGKGIKLAANLADEGERSLEQVRLPVLYHKLNDRWEIAISLSEGQFDQVSFVNSIATTRGGTHVNIVADAIAQAIAEHVRRTKGLGNLRPFQVKNHLWVFVNCLVENPAFDSQTKCTLTTAPASFGSTPLPLPDRLVKNVLGCGVQDRVMAWAKMKEATALTKHDGGNLKKAKLFGIPKLDDASLAGGARASECTLILTEGDSAKALAVSGLGVIGRERYGVFPLRGKLLNVREASTKAIMGNQEISALKKILGLQTGKVYTSTDSLRYGRVMVMADQDHDGSHIKGLLINFIHSFWPSLLELDPPFLSHFITPIVKVSKGAESRAFFTLPEYVAWKEVAQADSLGRGLRGWRSKYYKGLGTSTSNEAKEYFANMDMHCKDFHYSDDASSNGVREDDALLDMAFSKKKAGMRKEWLLRFEHGTYLDHSTSQGAVSFRDFINKELVLFSMADNVRSIPSAVDGLKPSQRKVLFSCFKRRLHVTDEIKVAQLAGYVSEHSAYHHGEASLQSTIVNMAQSYVGSNNVNLLVPSGQFGTRLLGGKDAASPRYIFTRLDPIARAIFPEADEALLEYLDDDGYSIEPKWYMPVIPLALVNGADGIGTGWSTMVPNYRPRDVVANLLRLLNGDAQEPMAPWYRGFRGEIVPFGGDGMVAGATGTTKFIARGSCERVNATTLRVTELPIGTWTNTYVDFLSKQIEAKTIENFVNRSTDTRVDFEIKVSRKAMADMEAMPGGLTKALRLETSILTSNMHLHDASGRIKKYADPTDVIQDFFPLRLEYYRLRREALLRQCHAQLVELRNKARFITAVIDGELVLSGMSKDALMGLLMTNGFDQMRRLDGHQGLTTADCSGGGGSISGSGSYDYLLRMPLWNLTQEKVEQLCNARNTKQTDYDALTQASAEELWWQDLQHLDQELLGMERASD